MDIGDSSGTHIGYLKALKPDLDARFVSLNLDPEAVKRIQAKGLEALELCPEDLRLLFDHTGWRVARERIYMQYPRRPPLALTRPLWARWDFEGFYGAVLEPDETWSSLYGSWS